MPTFKYKTNKKIDVDDKTLVTLDSKHSEFVSKFDNYEESLIPSLLEEKSFLTSEITGNSLLSLDEVLDMKDRIKEINAEIRELEREKKEYYLNNTKHIFNYFEKRNNNRLNQLNKKYPPDNRCLIHF